MAAALIATTRAREIQALGTAGQLTTDSWAALHRLLTQRLGPDHAALLAEPVTNAAQGETDWYADTALPARPLSSLPPDEAAAARAALDRLSGDTLALAASMTAAGSDADRFLGAMLSLTMQVPDDGFIHVAGAQPVLVAWGHARAGAAEPPVVLGGARQVRGRATMAILPPPAAPASVARRWAPALAASLCVALLVLGAALYIVARDPFRWYAVAEPPCEPPGADMALRADLATAADRESDLRLQLAQLSTDAGGRRLMCPPVQPAALPVPPPPPRTADENRAQQRGAQRGKLTIILAWDDRNDLDLYVRCPAGGVIFYQNRNACGGQLDVDANGDQRTADVQPVENVFFAAPAPGAYRIAVDPYAMRVGRTTPFRVTVQQDGRPDQVITGVAENGRHMQDVGSVTIGAPP